ncbi:hypothetical protein D3C71_1503770 [compost metagenome]
MWSADAFALLHLPADSFHDRLHGDVDAEASQFGDDGFIARCAGVAERSKPFQQHSILIVDVIAEHMNIFSASACADFDARDDRNSVLLTGF